MKLHFPLSTNFFLHSQKQKSSEDEGWVYARLPHLTYHCTKRSLDFARQRRWQCRLKRVDEDAISLPVFHFGLKKVCEWMKECDSGIRIILLLCLGDSFLQKSSRLQKRRKSRKDEEVRLGYKNISGNVGCKRKCVCMALYYQR